MADIKLGLKALTHLSSEQGRPSWLDDSEAYPAREMLAFPNALVHLPSFATAPDTGVIAPTPRLFSTSCLPFAFDPVAPEPEKWLEFLDQILDNDDQAKQLLQEWFGYCLTPDTSQQKILMLIGQTRSGKGTIGRVLLKLLRPKALSEQALLRWRPSSACSPGSASS